MRSIKRQKNRWKRLLRKSALILLILLILFSVLPYLLAPRELSLNRHDLAHDNSEFMVVDGVELHFRRWDLESSAGNVLLVHGLGGSTFSWRYTAQDLSENGFRVVAVDLPGFGLSERRQGFDHSPQARAEILWSLADELYPGERWHLVGHSMGGAVITAMALQDLERVVSMVPVAGAIIDAGPRRPTWVFRYPPLRRWLRVIGSRYLTEDNVEQLLSGAYGREPSPAEVEGYYLPLNVAGSDLVLADLAGARFRPPPDLLAGLRLPVLCIWGERDSWVPLENGEALVRLLPRAELVIIAGEGHCPMETAPQLFSGELLAFLQGL